MFSLIILILLLPFRIRSFLFFQIYMWACYLVMYLPKLDYIDWFLTLSSNISFTVIKIEYNSQNIIDYLLLSLLLLLLLFWIHQLMCIVYMIPFRLMIIKLTEIFIRLSHWLKNVTILYSINKYVGWIENPEFMVDTRICWYILFCSCCIFYRWSKIISYLPWLIGWSHYI